MTLGQWLFFTIGVGFPLILVGYAMAHKFYQIKDRQREKEEFSQWLEKTAKDTLEGKQ